MSDNGGVRVAKPETEPLPPHTLRRIWRHAAWAMLKRGLVRGAVEAGVNACRDNPPTKWSSGNPLYKIEEDE